VIALVKDFEQNLKKVIEKPYLLRLQKEGYQRLPQVINLAVLYNLKPIKEVSYVPLTESLDINLVMPLETFINVIRLNYEESYLNGVDKVLVTPEQFSQELTTISEFDVISSGNPFQSFMLYVFQRENILYVRRMKYSAKSIAYYHPEEALKLFKIASIKDFRDLSIIYSPHMILGLIFQGKKYFLSRREKKFFIKRKLEESIPVTVEGHKMWVETKKTQYY
jgi:hypothetical protein